MTIPKFKLPIAERMRRGELPNRYELQESDVGETLEWLWGRVMPIDVGKITLIRGGEFYIENEQQRDERKRKGQGWHGDTPGHKKAALKAQRKGAIDEPIQTSNQNLEHQVRELGMWIDNTYKLYLIKVAIFKNYWKKFKKGTFDKQKAEKGFADLTKAAADDYNRQNFEDFPKIGIEARKHVSKELVDEFLAAAKNKEYDFMR